MSDLVAFLTARLDEDRVAASAAEDDGDGQWAATRGHDGYLHNDGPHLETGDGEDWVKQVNTGVWLCDDPADDCEYMRGRWMAQANHASRHDPVRVLHEVAAKRAIVEDYLVVIANNATERANGGDEVATSARDLITKSLRMALLRLAAVWSEHPDFDPAWKIEG